MDDHAVAFKHCLNRLDIDGMRKLWFHVSPHLPQPKSDAEILTTLHHARTLANTMSTQKRAYSHAWLRERGYPSGLPDHMKQSAERLYPTVAKAVGISVNFSSPILKPVALEVRGAMEDAVQDAYAEGKRDDTVFIRERMTEARENTLTKLMGRIAHPN